MIIGAISRLSAGLATLNHVPVGGGAATITPQGLGVNETG